MRTLRYIFKLLFLILAVVDLHAIEIDSKTSGIDLLSRSSIFIDDTNTLSLDEVRSRQFTQCEKEILGFGFVPDKVLWIRFTLKNTTDATLHKVLQFDNATTENIRLYYDDKVINDGMWNMDNTRTSLHPSFEISLEPYEEKSFYIKAHSKISTLIAKLVLWEKEPFLQYEYERKTYLFLFFAVLVTLLLYNLMLYVFTKDRAYLYYILYLASVIFFQSNYLGISQLYLFSNEITAIVAKASMTYISFLIISILLFTREFLHTSKFEKLDFVLKVYLYITPVIALLSYDNFLFDMNIILVFIPLGMLVVFTGFYALYKGVKQAKFYVLGWSFVIFSLIFINLKATGLFDITKYFLYINELAFVLEALLFSIALAHRIKILSEEKSEADTRLIEFQKQEQLTLKRLVDEKTADLLLALNQKELLYKELNHRVKNNLQMVLSLIKLQILKSSSHQTKNELEITKNRINSISHLYETLHLDTKSENISTYEYCKKIAQNLDINPAVKIDVVYDIKHNLSIDHLVYCGLILNELMTNAIKYAFTNSGELKIDLYKIGRTVFLTVQDNGAGFEQKGNISLGLEIVRTLVTKQLLGDMVIDSKDGTVVKIKWDENE
ncbi:hypothetical protein KJ877_03510 [bacterium]|nr:hypothetical protein [bacterium]MBU1990577.1 hypothetical protein [bacterium]